MPLSGKGRKIRAAMRKRYGKKKGDQVFYATENKGRIDGLRRFGRGKDLVLWQLRSLRQVSG
jgi:hypothetical protein